MKISTIASAVFGALTAASGLCSDEHPIDVTSLRYDDNGFDLKGYVSVPSKTPAPAVVILPDWTGVNTYEKQRATMIASELGYVGFAADIYGADINQTFIEIDERRELATLYRSNLTLFASRIKAAIEVIKTHEDVDEENVAIVGYCFGGTGAISYALLGGDGVVGSVSLHGGLTSGIPSVGPDMDHPILVLSGGDDDASSDIKDLEARFNNASGTWEITRYSGIDHAFTVWSDDRYDEWADMRSWDSMTDFLSERFGETSYDDDATGPTEDEVDEAIETVDYLDGDFALRGYLAMPDETSEGATPAVIILPDWTGNNQYEKQRATMLAEMGYIGFAADIYGADLQDDIPFNVRANLTSYYRRKVDKFVSRIQAAIDEVSTYPEVNVSKIAIIGYCFGGTGVVDYAFEGLSEVQVVVAFHGGLTDLTSTATDVSPYVLVLSGGKDDAHGDQTELEAALDGRNATWEVSRYSDVFHGFTEWGGAAYNARADDRSWEAMAEVFEELIPIPDDVGDATKEECVEAKKVYADTYKALEKDELQGRDARKAKKLLARLRHRMKSRGCVERWQEGRHADKYNDFVEAIHPNRKDG